MELDDFSSPWYGVRSEPVRRNKIFLDLHRLADCWLFVLVANDNTAVKGGIKTCWPTRQAQDYWLLVIKLLRGEGIFVSN